MPETIPCPECGGPAQITERFWLESTDGPVEHHKIGCVHEHWFTPRAETVQRERPAAPGSRADSGSELIGPGAQGSPLISAGAWQVSGMAGVAPISWAVAWKAEA